MKNRWTHRAALLLVFSAMAAPLLFPGIRTSLAVWTDQTTNPGNVITANTLSVPTNVVGTQNPDCTNINITWNAGGVATGFRIESSTNGGASWNIVAADTGTTATNYADTTDYTGINVYFRVTELLSGTSWESSPSAPSAVVVCGVPPITDLAATNPCSSVLLTWTQPPGTNKADLRVSVNGGAWTIFATGTTSPYSDTTAYTTGDSLEYQARAQQGAATSTWSPSVSVSNWDNFRITSVSLINSGTAGTLNAGDQVVVTFSKDVNTTGVTNTGIQTRSRNELRVPNGNPPGSRIGNVTGPNNTFSGNGIFAGTNTWSGAGNRTYTWTSSGGGVNQANGFSTAMTVDSAVTCLADGTYPVSAPVPAGTF